MIDPVARWVGNVEGSRRTKKVILSPIALSCDTKLSRAVRMIGVFQCGDRMRGL